MMPGDLWDVLVLNRPISYVNKGEGNLVSHCLAKPAHHISWRGSYMSSSKNWGIFRPTILDHI